MTRREKELLKIIDRLTQKIQSLEEELERTRFENRTLHTTIQDLKRDLKAREYELEHLRRDP
jgi:hypothetical protein